jgi:tetratricopeptide (TPR) repeat protein
VKLSHEEDAYAKLALLREVAALYEGKVREPQKAFDRYLAAFALFPADEQTSADAERAAKATGGWQHVVDAYKAAVEQATDQGDAGLAVTLRLKLGRVLVDEMQQIDEALTAFRGVYDADSENADALAALERLYRATGRQAELLGIYEKRRELSGDPSEKTQLSFEIAKLYETELKDNDKAIETYVQVLEDEPTNHGALRALDVLYGQLERWEPYVDVLRRALISMHVAKLSDAERADKLSELFRFITSPAFRKKLAEAENLAGEALELDVQEKRAHDNVWKKRGMVLSRIKHVLREIDTDVSAIIETPSASRPKLAAHTVRSDDPRVN